MCGKALFGRIVAVVAFSGILFSACADVRAASPANADATTTNSHAQEAELMNEPPRASRPPPKSEAQPVVVGSVRYEPDGAVVGEKSSRSKAYMVTAKDTGTGKKLWSATVYEVALVPGLETDVQGRNFASMSLMPGDKQLLVVDERGNRFIVDLERHTSSPVK